MSTEQSLAIAAVDSLWDAREELIAGLVRVTPTQIAALDHDAALRSLLEASITENIVAALNFIKQGIDPDDLEAPTAALAYARVLAQRDVPLSALIRAYRIGHSLVLDQAFASLDDLPPDDRVPLVLFLVRRSALFIDQICEQVGRAYERERERWVAGRSGVRQQWVNELLGGGPVDRAAAERALRYRHARPPRSRRSSRHDSTARGRGSPARGIGARAPADRTGCTTPMWHRSR
ncbi:MULTISPECIES: hypothetical protein [unclassified Streptomyces]|uniref:hypothetical protein n=1 Tax=unclassified Streptomyces TaxID=2593676 RepID=UPI002DDB6A3E|nr:hypothetical protein [Streptomyces sp. NBC_01445]WSE02596.1 hypothetical protein OG574_03905 [Streptomyces sp. NBC_01445]